MRAISVLLLFLLSACAGEERACPLVPVAELPFRFVQNVPVLTVQINGRPAQMVLDTGSDATVLNRAAAQRLGLVVGDGTRAVRGAGGSATVGMTQADTLALGAAVRHGARILVSDSPAPPLDGLVGIDTLVAYEIDLDEPHRRVALYQARPCADALPAFPGPIVRLPVRPQPGSGHLFVGFSVDGQPMRGLLDSGASTTELSLMAAEDAGITPRQLARLPSGLSQTINREALKYRRARFRSLQIGDDVLPDPLLAIADLPSFAGDALIGQDYIGTRRMWFSFRTGQVFVEGRPPR